MLSFFDATRAGGMVRADSEFLDSEEILYCLRILHPRLEVAVARDAARDCWNIGRERVRALDEKYTGELLSRARSRLSGHLQYYAITDNSDRCQTAHILTTRILFKWLNRRSQHKSYNWQRFDAVLNTGGWPVVHVRHTMCPFRSLPNVGVKSRMRESPSSGSVRGMGHN